MIDAPPLLASLRDERALFTSCGEPEDGPRDDTRILPHISFVINDKEGNCILPEIPGEEESCDLEYFTVKYDISGRKVSISEWGLNNRLIINKETEFGENVRSLDLFTLDFIVALSTYVKQLKDEVFHVKMALMCPAIFPDREEHLFEFKIHYIDGDTRYFAQIVENSIFVDGIPATLIGDEFGRGIYEVNLSNY